MSEVWMEYGKPLSVCAPAIRGRQRWSPARFPGAYPGGPGSSSVVNHDSRTEANLGRSSLRISVCSGLPACQVREDLLDVAGVRSKLGRRERIADSMGERKACLCEEPRGCEAEERAGT